MLQSDASNSNRGSSPAEKTYQGTGAEGQQEHGFKSSTYIMGKDCILPNAQVLDEIWALTNKVFQFTETTAIKTREALSEDCWPKKDRCQSYLKTIYRIDGSSVKLIGFGSVTINKMRLKSGEEHAVAGSTMAVLPEYRGKFSYELKLFLIASFLHYYAVENNFKPFSFYDIVLHPASFQAFYPLFKNMYPNHEDKITPETKDIIFQVHQFKYPSRPADYETPCGNMDTTWHIKDEMQPQYLSPSSHAGLFLKRCSGYNQHRAMPAYVLIDQENLSYAVQFLAKKYNKSTREIIEECCKGMPGLRPLKDRIIQHCACNDSKQRLSSLEYVHIDLKRISQQERSKIVKGCEWVARQSFIMIGEDEKSTSYLDAIHELFTPNEETVMSKLIVCREKETGKIVGYAHRAIYRHLIDQQIHFIMKLAVAVIPEYRGKCTLDDVGYSRYAMIDAIKQKLSHPCTDVVFFICFLHPAPYHMFTKYTYGLFPSPECKLDKKDDKLLKELSTIADHFGMHPISGKSPFMRKYPWATKDNSGDKTLTNAAGRFFMAHNALYSQGYCLISLGPVTFKNIFFTLFKIAGKVIGSFLTCRRRKAVNVSSMDSTQSSPLSTQTIVDSLPTTALTTASQSASHASNSELLSSPSNDSLAVSSTLFGSSGSSSNNSSSNSSSSSESVKLGDRQVAILQPS